MDQAHVNANVRRGHTLLIGPYRVMFKVQVSEVAILSVVDGRRDLSELLIERALRP